MNDDIIPDLRKHISVPVQDPIVLDFNMHEMLDFKNKEIVRVLIIFCGSSMVQEKGLQWYLESQPEKKGAFSHVYYMLHSTGNSE